MSTIQTYAYKSCVPENTAASAMRRGKNARNVAEKQTGKKIVNRLHLQKTFFKKKKTDDQNILLQEDCMKGITQRLKNLNAMSKAYLRSLSVIEMKTEEAFEVIKLVINNIKAILKN